MSMSREEPNLEDLLRLGIQSAKAGNKANARVIFQQVLDTDRRNERAWLWMASIADEEADKRRYLETVLSINPNNTRAKEQLARINKEAESSESQSIALGVVLVIGVLLFLVVVGVLVVSIT
jgi:thioredoxin-like negative regulator of GroEL